MISDRILRACVLNQFFSEKCCYPRYIIEWDYKANTWKAEKDWRKMLTWYNAISLLISGILWPLVSFFVIIVQGIFYPKSITNDVLFYNVIIMTPCVLNFGINFVLFNERDVLVEYTGLFLQFVGQYQPMPSTENMTIRQILADLKQEATKILKTRQGDFLGVTVTLAILLFTYGSYFVGLTGIVAQLDSFATVFRFIRPVEDRSQIEHILLALLSALLIGIVAMEACRTFRYMFVYLIMGAIVNGWLVNTVYKDSKINLRNAVETYDRLYTIHNKMLVPGGKILFVAIHGGQFLAVFNLAGAIIGWKFLSPIAHWVPIFMASLTVFIMMVAIPFAIAPAKQSEAMIQEWKFRNRIEGGSRFQRKSLASFRPIGFPIAGVGSVTPEFKAHFWSIIVLNTTDVILMIMQSLPN
ncbi:unnamed protein product [Orchesella dallaii]|uniref:Odorant receptor n=1 Tax=Orchesella dallaii TaxID=48710 RepID=A0ABP1SB28_9HEXA